MKGEGRREERGEGRNEMWCRLFFSIFGHKRVSDIEVLKNDLMSDPLRLVLPRPSPIVDLSFWDHCFSLSGLVRPATLFSLFIRASSCVTLLTYISSSFPYSLYFTLSLFVFFLFVRYFCNCIYFFLSLHISVSSYFYLFVLTSFHLLSLQFHVPFCLFLIYSRVLFCFLISISST